MTDALKICLVAGEASGDALGAPLMAALTKEAGRPVQYSGVGGPMMAAQGLDSLFLMETLSVMGVAEVLPKLPMLVRCLKQVVRHIEMQKPDIVITIDAPDFAFRVVRKLRREAKNNRRPLPLLIHYIAPSVWAWRPGRAAKVAKLYDGLLCALPFEPPYFTRHEMAAVYVGHSVLERDLQVGDGVGFRAAHGILHGKKTLGLLFGSRRGEVKRVGPILRDATILLARTQPNLHLVVPIVPHLKNDIETLLSDVPLPSTVIVDEKADSFAAMDAALAVSGTVALELAVAGVPHAIAYRMNVMTAWLLRRLLRVRFAHLANIILEQGGRA